MPKDIPAGGHEYDAAQNKSEENVRLREKERHTWKTRNMARSLRLPGHNSMSAKSAFLSTGDLLIRMPVLLPPGTEQACPHSSPGMHPVPSCVSIDTIPSNLLVHRLSPVDHPYFHRVFHLPVVLDSLLRAATRNRCTWKKSSTAGLPAWDFHTIRFALGISQWALWNNAST